MSKGNEAREYQLISRNVNFWGGQWHAHVTVSAIIATQVVRDGLVVERPKQKAVVKTADSGAEASALQIAEQAAITEAKRLVTLSRRK